MVSRRQLARWGVEHIRFRLAGLDRRAHRPRSCSQVKRAPRRGSGARDRPHGPGAPGRRSCRASTRRCSTRCAPTRTPAGATFIVSAAGNDLVEILAAVLRHGRRDRDPLRGRRRRRAHRPARRAVRLRRGQGRGDASVRRPSTTSTSAPPGRTRTRPPTCRCCARSATRSPSTRTPSWREIAERGGWRVMRFEKLGRRLRSPGRRWSPPRSAARAPCSRAPAPLAGRAARGRAAPLERRRRAADLDFTPWPWSPEPGAARTSG